VYANKTAAIAGIALIAVVTVRNAALAQPSPALAEPAAKPSAASTPSKPIHTSIVASPSEAGASAAPAHGAKTPVIRHRHAVKKHVVSVTAALRRQRVAAQPAPLQPPLCSLLSCD